MKVLLGFVLAGVLGITLYAQGDRCGEIIQKLQDRSVLRGAMLEHMQEFSRSWPKSGITVTLNFRAHDSAALARSEFLQSLPESISVRPFDHKILRGRLIEKHAKASVSSERDFEALLGALQKFEPIVVQVAKNKGSSIRTPSVASQFKDSVKTVRGYAIQQVTVRGDTISVVAVGLSAPGSRADPFPTEFKAKSGKSYTVKLRLSAARG